MDLREEAVLVRAAARKSIMAGIDGSLRRLATDDRPIVEALHRVAAARGLTPAQIALAWLLGKPGVAAPIVGAAKLRHVTDAVAAFDVVLSPEATAALEAPFRPIRVLGHT